MCSRAVLRIDAPRVTRAIEATLREQTLSVLRRRGAVVAVSGGIAGSVVAARCARALGPDRVLALSMPERARRDVEAKRRGSQYLHPPPLLADGGAEA